MDLVFDFTVKCWRKRGELFLEVLGNQPADTPTRDAIGEHMFELKQHLQRIESLKSQQGVQVRDV